MSTLRFTHLGGLFDREMRPLLRGPGGGQCPGDLRSFPPPAPTSAAFAPQREQKSPRRQSLGPWPWAGVSREAALAPRRVCPSPCGRCVQPRRTGRTGASRWLQKSHSQHAPFAPELYQSATSRNPRLWGTLSPGALSPRASLAPAGARVLRRGGARARRAGRQALRFAESGLPDSERRRERERRRGGGAGAGGSLLNQPAGCSNLGHH